VKAAKAVNYVGAGTIEFIADGSEGLRADRVWFMEMNTRLQVEHPVTEAITGEDLVEWQLRVASGERLPKRQDELSIHGWAMEARLYAENPTTGFLPSVGPLRRLRFPASIRVDSGVEEGGEVSPHYDPMIAKLIAYGPTRKAAAETLAKACGEVQVWPLKTNAAFLTRCLADKDFVAGDLDTGFIERHAGTLVPTAEPSEAVLQAAAQALLPKDTADPWRALNGFRLNGPREARVQVEVAGHPHIVALGTAISGKAETAEIEDEQVLFLNGEAWAFGQPRAGHGDKGATGDGSVISPMPGRITALHVQAGETVIKGQKLMVLEAMKMELGLIAPFDGTVAELRAEAEQQVTEGTLLVRIEPKKE
jgi:3-methylcrotonyl-CoA carboxylase alpha subunit